MNLRQKNIRKKLARQAGFTIVELSVAVAIAGILLVGAISLVQTVLQTSRANDTIGGLARVFAQIEKLYNTTQNYSGIDSAGMIGLGVFQGPFTIVGTPPAQTANNRFGYKVDVLPINDYPDTSRRQAYAVMFRGIPQKVCADIVTAADSAGVKSIAIGTETAPGISATFDTAVAGLKNANPFVTGGAVNIVKGTNNNGVLDSALLAGSGGVASGCNLASTTVAIAMINWK